MKTTILKTGKIKNIFNQLHHNLGGSLNVETNEYILDIDSEIGQGSIRGITFKGGISYLEFDVQFMDDFTLAINSPNASPIYFAYCSQGSLMHSFGAMAKKRELQKFQTGILTSKAGQEHCLHFKKAGNAQKTTLIVVNTTSEEAAQKKDLNYKLHQTFFSEKDQENFFYVGSFNLKIADKIQQLHAIKEKGMVRSLNLEGLVHMILALEIQQHSDDLEHQSKNVGALTLREMEEISELSSFIQNYPEVQFTVQYLSRKSGLSPTKLQEGFKAMHDRTVADYIREVRVQKAEELIKNTDLNISEVVYSIGLTSRSYFSKIFKQKYDCSPKRYKDNQNYTAAIA
jgi:AraC-like DNA-binding protein